MAKAKKKSSPAKGDSDWNEWRKILTWIGIVLGVLLLLTLIGMFITFSGYREYPKPNIGKPHYRFLRDLASQMRNNRRQNEATIRLSREEVQLLLDLIRHSAQFVGSKHNVPQQEHFMLTYNDDCSLGFAVPVDVAGSWCFGGKIYVSGSLFLEKKGDEIIADLPKLRFGRFDLPVPGGADTVDSDWQERMKRVLPQDIMGAIRSIHSERDGTVVMVYSPSELRKPLKKYLDKIHERCAEDLKPWIRQLIQSL